MLYAKTSYPMNTGFWFDNFKLKNIQSKHHIQCIQGSDWTFSNLRISNQNFISNEYSALIGIKPKNIQSEHHIQWIQCSDWAISSLRISNQNIISNEYRVLIGQFQSTKLVLESFMTVWSGLLVEGLQVHKLIHCFY